MFSRDASYRLTGGLPIVSAKAVARHIGVDTAIVETPFTPASFAATSPGCGIVLQRDGRQEFSGLVGSSRETGIDTDGKPTIKVMCVGDAIHLQDRIVFPDPARAGDDQSTVDYWSRTVPASTAMAALLSEQLGPQALPERRVPTLYAGPDPGVGVSRLWSFMQTDTVLSACQQISLLSGVDLGIRILSTVDGLRFDIYRPQQLAGAVRFSAGLRNLGSFTYAEVAPTVTYAVVAGQGDLHLRTRRAAASGNALDLRWGRRIEAYIDRRDEADGAVLSQAALDAIADGAGQVSLSCQLTDSQAAKYGRDWFLGDQVTVYVGVAGLSSAATVTDVVREIAFTVDSAGAETIVPAVGTADAKSIFPTPTQQRLAAIADELRAVRRK
jgi:hypothetical protein